MHPADADSAAHDSYSPSELVRHVRDLLEDSFPLVWIEGELSGISRPSSGHIYFAIKDAQAQVRCAMFRMRASLLRFRPAEGMHVRLRARVSLYEARGEFQLIVEHMEEAGEGALLRAFEQLKARLAAEGLFDPARKRALPRWPRRIGVITSPTGAAVRDVISVFGRRCALLSVEVLPVPVQGREAPPAIAAMLRAAAATQRYDVLLLTRGGGSLEDLWAFNDEQVARAIHASSVPVVSAIGHEIDFTIADFVADLRAATPSAAAELIAPDLHAVRRALARERDVLVQWLQRRLERDAQRLDQLGTRLAAQHPRARLRLGAQRLAQLAARFAAQHPRHRLRQHLERLRQWRARLEARAPGPRIERQRERLQALRARLAGAARQGLVGRGRVLAELARTLHAVSPLATQARGYAILTDRDGQRVLRTRADVNAADRLRARLADGEIDLRVDREPGTRID